MIVCSPCFDKGKEAGEWERFLAVLTQQKCDVCDRPCLGYLVRTDPSVAKEADV
jgi:hypothetical protein